MFKDAEINNTITVFLDKVAERYPHLEKMGMDMGLTKQGISDTIGNLGDDNTINTYILVLSRMLGL